ncbi:hypothetical protein ALC57_15028 [Trachymyrmex cornetzi]|uniref:HAT C-terminal dimerisation domain-containing protein n=1 Tax=Trachymyrmex cornetzi TaxID=471704 RepID=A0A151IXH8_9HYME|nr:hypothetical protein ALC57_15028 [Trachymyrmex cornetzi]
MALKGIKKERKFKNSWLDENCFKGWLDENCFKGWLTPHPVENKAFCLLCKKSIRCTKTDLMRHPLRAKHIEKVNCQSLGNNNNNRDNNNNNSNNLHAENVKRAEIKLAARIKDSNGDQMFSTLESLIEVMFSLPHSNAEAERIFSIVSDVKNKKRNRLSNDIVSAICIIRSSFQTQGNNCLNFEVEPRHLELHNSENLYKK